MFPSILNAIKEDKEIKINSSKDVRRDFVHLDDVLDAFLKCINFKGNNFEVFNIGSGYSISIEEILKTFSGILNRELDVSYLNSKKDDVKDIYINFSKARSLLGWEPKTKIEEGIRYILT